MYSMVGNVGGALYILNIVNILNLKACLVKIFLMEQYNNYYIMYKPFFLFFNTFKNYSTYYELLIYY